ncbi:sigma-70 family RNA polymerase sigma factor [Mycobacterium sp. CVI_P3]|uniref:RNA polymerase sigma factor n=1 Tax=Mycobacterium pinniadriaticum TaxID=2994102 RepID=A0ABT3S9K0_9MYCO|nr:sigma-70 family RNA polymerase sigma factor [Mycobacterium pinniadriaticum]MCX2929390.1 sigma-70 family RNA polymerase sigma factor [Mycobacterium pinniadriaticum]MCX2935814.1 sigma-70 family RNA polymerase sigma factor [Mycobacterium pinniadriaticum]
MTPTSLPRRTDPDAAARFARDAQPLFDALLRRARGLTTTAVDAEDLVQDTLLNAFVGYHTFSDGTDFKAWLFRILYNRWVSTYRAKQRRPSEVLIDDVIEGDVAGSPVGLSTASRSAEAEALTRLPDHAIRSAMATLPADFRTALFYAEVRGHTLAETATILNVPRGTVMSRVSRGRQRLRAALAESGHASIAQIA